jgi:hypothetical protein
MKTIQSPNLQILTKAHENKWVALSSDYDRVVAVADTLAELEAHVADKDVVVLRVLPFHLGYAPATRS